MPDVWSGGLKECNILATERFLIRCAPHSVVTQILASLPIYGRHRMMPAKWPVRFIESFGPSELRYKYLFVEPDRFRGENTPQGVHIEREFTSGDGRRRFNEITTVQGSNRFYLGSTADICVAAF